MYSMQNIFGYPNYYSDTKIHLVETSDNFDNEKQSMGYEIFLLF